jgi:hypothetical protein
MSSSDHALLSYIATSMDPSNLEYVLEASSIILRMPEVAITLEQMWRKDDDE